MMFPARRSNQITYRYYCQLMSHTWSRHRVQRVERRNGCHVYSTYHLTDVL